MTDLFKSGIRPAIDEYLAKKSAEVRDYGDFWSASSGGYCMRKVVFDRKKIPPIKEDARLQRVFESGHIFHEWVQRITKDTGLSVLQEYTLEDDRIKVRGHFDDVVLLKSKLVLYDYKTAHSKSFHWSKDRPMSYYHKMQVGTYMYMFRKLQSEVVKPAELINLPLLEEARVMKISKDDLVMQEHQLLYTPKLQQEVLFYWRQLNEYWREQKMPPCTCHKYEGGFMADERYNPYFYEGEPCSLEWYKLKRKEVK